MLTKAEPPRSLDALAGLEGRDWIRESTKAQFDRHDGNAQRVNCAAFRERFGVVEGPRAYVVAHSGNDVWKSTTMADLLADVRAREFRVLVTGYYDRWQRNLRRTLEIVEDVLHPNGVAWVMADRRLISGDPRDWQEMRDLANEAQKYRENLSEKVRDGYAAKLARRHDQGGGLVPFGFRRDPGTKLVVPDPDAMPMAVRVWELSASGRTDAAVAAEVGLTLWQVRKILQSPLFAGLVRPGIEANFPAPVPREIRELAQDRRRARNRVGNRARTFQIHPLSGHGPLVCDECGRAIKGDTKVRRAGDRVRIYRHTDGAECEGWPVKEVPAAVIEEQVAVLLDRAAPAAESIERIREAFGHPAVSVDRFAVARIDSRLKALGQELVAASRSRPGAEVLAEIEGLRSERARVVDTPVPQELVSPETAIDYLASLGRLWRATDDEGRRMLAVATFSEIRVRGSKERASHRVMSVALTADAERHGLGLVLPSQPTNESHRDPVGVELSA